MSFEQMHITPIIMLPLLKPAGDSDQQVDNRLANTAENNIKSIDPIMHKEGVVVESVDVELE
jgi:hypothetical protein